MTPSLTDFRKRLDEAVADEHSMDKMILAAMFGGTNMGLQVAQRDLNMLIAVAKNKKYRKMDLDGAVHILWASYAPDLDIDDVIEEAKSWETQLAAYSDEQIESTWPDAVKQYKIATEGTQ